ncbi:hypothetical protein Ndes2526A_g07196 [Nannochloris sp. 'desiccata']
MQPRTGKHLPLPARPLSFTAALPATAGGFSLQNLTTTTTNKNNTFKGNHSKVEDDGISPLLYRIAPPPGCPWLAEFGELADLSKLGSLPSEDDILLKFAENTEEEIISGSELFQNPQKLQQQDHYLNQPRSYFPLEQQPTQYQKQHQMWVPHQSYEGDFAGTPTPLFTPINDRLPQEDQQKYHLHPSSLHPGRQDAGNYPPSSSSSFYLGNLPPGGQQQQPRSAKYNSSTRTTNINKNKRTHLSLSALPDDFQSDDPGANTGKTYRGVSRHRLTQRWEASLWLNGRQLYLGGFDAQIDAAKAYDLAALACKGSDAIINFPAEEYDWQLREIAGFSREEVVAYVRRRSAAFSRGKSKYRGVSGHNGRYHLVFLRPKNAREGNMTEPLSWRKGGQQKTNFPLRDYEAEVEIYKVYMARTCGQLPRGSTAVIREVEAYTLPRNRVATADEKKRSAIIYGESLRQALEGQ